MRIYKRTYGLRQICNIAVYIVHSACTIHLLNLPEKDAQRDIIHGVKHLEEIAQDWLCARRTLSIISVLARKWNSQLPEEATTVLARTDAKYGFFSTADVPSPKSDLAHSPPATSPHLPRTPETTDSQNTLMGILYGYNQPETHASPNIDANGSVEASRIDFHGINSTAGPTTITNGPPTSYPGTTAPISPSRPEPHGIATPAAPLHNAASAPRMSPSTLFGGHDAWLRDQANLAVGFDNWIATGANIGDQRGEQADLLNGMNPDYFLASPGKRGRDEGYAGDGWLGYN
jgi:hypothetical protein